MREKKGVKWELHVLFFFLVKSKGIKVVVANLEKKQHGKKDFFEKVLSSLLLIIIIIHVTILYTFYECLKYFIIKQLKQNLPDNCDADSWYSF